MYQESVFQIKFCRCLREKHRSGIIPSFNKWLRETLCTQHKSTVFIHLWLMESWESVEWEVLVKWPAKALLLSVGLIQVYFSPCKSMRFANQNRWKNCEAYDIAFLSGTVYSNKEWGKKAGNQPQGSKGFVQMKKDTSPKWTHPESIIAIK